VPDAYQKTESLRKFIKSVDKTTLLPRVLQTPSDRSDAVSGNPDLQFTSYGYIGLCDFTMYPLIWQGSFVELDTRENKLRLIAWRTEMSGQSTSLNDGMVIPAAGVSCRESNFYSYRITRRTSISGASSHDLEKMLAQSSNVTFLQS
jgi:hypothetical protein